MSDLRIGISIPLGRDGGRPDFWISFVQLMHFSLAAMLKLEREPPIHYNYERSSMIAQNRRRLVKYALRDKCSHVLFLDDDMVFPPDTLGRLLQHHKPVAAANCTTRDVPIIPTAIRNRERIPSLGRTGLEQVDAVGCAVMLIEAQVFYRLPLPWFAFETNEANPDNDMGEDMFFCRALKRADIPVYIDHDLSLEVGHVGEMTYVHEMMDHDALRAMNEANAMKRR